jgi:hypothetical protein
MKYIILAIILSGCQKPQVDSFPETIYPNTPTMQSAVDAMETK